MLLRLVLFLVSMIFASLVFSQIILPAIRGRTFFPLFRRKYRKAISELVEANRLEDEASMSKEAVEKRTQASLVEIDTAFYENDHYDDLINNIGKEKDVSKR